jgi:hypothetical protein
LYDVQGVSVDETPTTPPYEAPDVSNNPEAGWVTSWHCTPTPVAVKIGWICFEKLTSCGGGLIANLASDRSVADSDGVPPSCAVTSMWKGTSIPTCVARSRGLGGYAARHRPDPYTSMNQTDQ